MGHRLDDQHARHDRGIRVVALEKRLVVGDVLDADGRRVLDDVLDAIDQQEGIAVRNHPLDPRQIRCRRRGVSAFVSHRRLVAGRLSGSF